MVGGVKRWCVLIAIGLLVSVAILSTPVFTAPVFAQELEQEVPIEGNYIVNITTTELSHSERGRTLCLVFRTTEYKELKESLINEGFHPWVRNATAIKVVEYVEQNITDEYIWVYVPFKANTLNTSERAGISAIVKDGKVVEISGGYAQLGLYRAYFNFNVITAGTLNNIETLVLQTGNTISITTVVNGEVSSTTEIFTTDPSLEYAEYYQYWWGWKIVFSEWETATIIGAIGTASFVAALIAFFCPAAAPVAGPASLILAGVATSLWVIDMLGGYKGIYVAKTWFDGGWVWHN